jgi:HEAT repeat protein
MSLCRVSCACPVVVLVAFSFGATSAPAQAGQMGGAAAPTYADQPLAHWQDLLAQHVGKDSDADKEQCRRAAQALGRFGPDAKEAVPLLVQALQSPSTEVREFAVDALGRIGLEPQTVVSAIVAEADLPPEHINYAPLAAFRRLAARALGRFGAAATAAVPMLEKALQNEDPLYRVQAALALWKISQHPQAIPVLRAALKQNESETAFEAVLAVAEIGAGAKAAAPDLIEALNHPDPDVRRAAASALVAWGADQLEPVAQRLSDGGFQSPAAAAYVLGQLLEELRPRVFYHPLMDAQQLAAATRPVVRLAAPALVRLLADPDPEVRQTARRSLAQMGLLAAPFLLQSLQSDKETVRPVAIEALTQLESNLPDASPVNPGMEVIKARLVPTLLELMKHADPQVRRAAYRAFARFSLGAVGKTAVPLLRSALRDQDLAIRRFAFEALQQQGEKSKSEEVEESKSEKVKE